MTSKLLVTLSALIGALIAFVAAMTLHITPAPPTFGAAGASQYAFAEFFGGMSVGQGINASSTSASVTMSGKEFLYADTLDYTINVGSVSLTLPASTTAMCTSLPKGQKRDVYIRNATTTASSALTIVGGTGFTLLSASSSKAVYGATNGYNTAKIVIQRLATSDCNALMTPFVP